MAVCARFSLWETAPLVIGRDAILLLKPLAYPVSPSAIELGMDKALRIFHMRSSPEDLVYDEHQGHYQDSANEARRKWVYPQEKRWHPKGV